MKRLEHLFLPANHNWSETDIGNARLLIRFLVVSTVFALGYWIDTYFTGFVAARYAMAFAGVAFVIQLIMLRKGAGIKAMAWLFILISWTIIVILAAFSGGIHSYVLGWVSLAPVITLLLLNQRSSWIVGSLSAVCILTFALVDFDDIIPAELAMSTNVTLIASLHIGLMMFLLSLTVVFDNQKRNLIQKISGHLEISEKNQAVVNAQNEDLEQKIIDRTEDLYQKNHRLQTFAFMASHNLRAPVSNIIGLGQILENDLSTAERNHFLQKLLLSTKQLDQVVKDLNIILDANQTQGKNDTTIDLEDAVSSALLSLEAIIKQTNASISIEMKVKEIQSVRTYIDSILVNLIGNALKYSNPKKAPLIKIGSYLKDNSCCLTVEDNGIGMDLKKHKEHLFQLYNQIDSNTDGKGMGLYLVKSHVESLGGQIDVESEVDIGTKFTITLNHQKETVYQHD